MPKVRTYSLDTLQKIRKQLNKQEKPKRTRELSTKAAIAALQDLLTDKLAAGWTLVDLAASLSEAGLPIAPKTLQEYLEVGHKSPPEPGGKKAQRKAEAAAEQEPLAAEQPATKAGTEAVPSGFVVMQEDEL